MAKKGENGKAKKAIGAASAVLDAARRQPAKSPWRWVITVGCPAGQIEKSNVEVQVLEQGVTRSELAYHLANALPGLIAKGGEILPTIGQMKAHRHRGQISQRHPATFLHAKEEIYLCKACEELFGAKMSKGIALPDTGAALIPCAYHLDPTLMPQLADSEGPKTKSKRKASTKKAAPKKTAAAKKAAAKKSSAKKAPARKSRARKTPEAKEQHGRSIG